MDMMPLKLERRAQLEEYAKRRGQDPATALDDALATYLEWERQDSAEAVEGVRQGYEDVRAGRTSPLPSFLLICAASMASVNFAPRTHAPSYTRARWR
ncbi:MAG: hypothetical protein LAO09_01250 [Acidobacteriia bacterium]|nr:hypothetical protein [Terriglobia bacterium]